MFFIGMYATLGAYNDHMSTLKHHYGLNHLHYITTSVYRRASASRRIRLPALQEPMGCESGRARKMLARAALPPSVHHRAHFRVWRREF